MMRTTALLIVLLAMLCIACKKGGGPAPVDDTCSWKKLTLVKTERQGNLPLFYNPDGTIRRMGFDVSYFNNGQLMEAIHPTDTVVLDSIGRLRYLKTAFGHDGGRQTRHYYYDDRNRVVKTLTHTGNGINYIAALTYSNDDVVEVAFDHDSIGAHASRSTFTHYDTLCVDHYPGIQYWTQIGFTRNKRLLKTSHHGDSDSMHYSYVLDSNKRVLVSYRNYDNSAWTYSRATDTTWYEYGCR